MKSASLDFPALCDALFHVDSVHACSGFPCEESWFCCETQWLPDWLVGFVSVYAMKTNSCNILATNFTLNIRDRNDSRKSREGRCTKADMHIISHSAEINNDVAIIPLCPLGLKSLCFQHENRCSKKYVENTSKRYALTNQYHDHAPALPRSSFALLTCPIHDKLSVRNPIFWQIQCDDYWAWCASDMRIADILKASAAANTNFDSAGVPFCYTWPSRMQVQRTF